MAPADDSAAGMIREGVMLNPHRGETTITIDGREHTMRLTLGALAGLEARLGAGSLMGLAERVEDGRVATGDLLALLAAGVAGAGGELDEARMAGWRRVVCLPCWRRGWRGRGRSWTRQRWPELKSRAGLLARCVPAWSFSR